MELLAEQHRKSTLLCPQVPIFHGEPINYCSFVRAFESLIDSCDRLYYLTQYTAVDIKELVQSCQHLSCDRRYKEAHRLIEKRFGDEYCVASTYECKALNWPPVKQEDSAALNGFSIFLASCKNAVDGSQYSSKFDQPDTIQKLIFKLPYGMRERWHHSVYDIMVTRKRPVEIPDILEFVDREARIATNPVFGTISESVRTNTDSHSGKTGQNSNATKPLSFAVQVDGGLDSLYCHNHAS